jgi:cystathionine gamma-synthase
MEDRRCRRASQTALAIATHFHQHPALAAVLYPGCPIIRGMASRPGRWTAGSAGCCPSGSSAGDGHARGVLREVRVFKRATSLGGVESLIEILRLAAAR